MTFCNNRFVSVQLTNVEMLLLHAVIVLRICCCLYERLHITKDA